MYVCRRGLILSALNLSFSMGCGRSPLGTTWTDYWSIHACLKLCNNFGSQEHVGASECSIVGRMCGLSTFSIVFMGFKADFVLEPLDLVYPMGNPNKLEIQVHVNVHMVSPDK
jgi:hypothetical protein